MKVNGVQITKCEEVVVLPRGGEGKDIPFRAKAVSINRDFNRLCPVPVAPMIQTKDGNRPDTRDESYVAALSVRDNQRFAYLCLRSLEPSNIEWETVDMEKPGTWLKWSDELLEAGLSEVELNRVINAVMAANSLDEEKVDAARKAFLLGPEA